MECITNRNGQKVCIMDNDSERHQKIVQAIIDDIHEMESIDIEKTYSRTMRKIRVDRFRRWGDRLIRVAAVLALPLLLTSVTLGYLYFHSPSEPVQYAEVTASPGSVLRYELPDKSVVWLNSCSRLKYPVKFIGDKREVSLDGEGYFEVTADKKHPFYVNTLNNLSVYVYGTHFDVCAYSDEPTIEAVLEEGKVNVIAPDSHSVIHLSPGEELSFNKKSGLMSKSDVDVYEKTAWRDGKLIFRNATLEEIFKRLSRHFNVKVDFNNFTGKTYHYRATFINETLSQILNYLSQSANLKWNIEEPLQKNDSSFAPSHVKVTLY
jgi:transmembrane sensor